MNESRHKSNKIWADKGSEFYNRSVKSWLQSKDITIYEVKSFVAEGFIRTLNNKIYKYMTSVSRLDDLVNEDNNTYHTTIKMKPINVKSSTYIGFNVENNDKLLIFNFKLRTVSLFSTLKPM